MVLSILLLSILQGCTLMHLLTLEKKSYDTDEEIHDFLDKIDIDTKHSYRIKSNYIDSLSMSKFALNNYKLEHNGIASPVQIRMYKTNSEFVYGWEQCFGDLNKLGVLNDFPLVEKKHLPVNRNLFLINELNMLDINNLEKKVLNNRIKEYDYIIFVYWSKWTGWWSKDALRRANKYITKHKENNIMFVKVNISK